MMKKSRSRWSVVSTIFVLLALTVVSASAQAFVWNDPQQVISAHVTAIAVDPVTESVYGIDDQGAVVPLILSTEQITGVMSSQAAPPPPAIALAMNGHGVLYAIAPTAVVTYSAGAPTLIDQPKLPQDVVGTFKDIAVGKGGKLCLLFEEDQSKIQYLLVGYPPAMTDGVTVAIKPTVLNLESKGNWVDAFVSPPEGYDAEDIFPESIKITRIQGTGPNGAIDQTAEIFKASGAPCRVEGEKLHLKFPRYNKQEPASSQSLVGVLGTLLPATSAKATYNLTLTIEGELEPGELFAGTTTLTVMVPKAKSGKKQ